MGEHLPGADFKSRDIFRDSCMMTPSFSGIISLPFAFGHDIFKYHRGFFKLIQLLALSKLTPLEEISCG